MDKSIDSSLELFKNVPRDVGDLEKFWDIFDTIPKIRGYHRGKIFQYSKGNIEIQDIAYGYTKKLNVFC
ncbi:MAG: hypothetical protein H6767_08200 [Candidatus Peribacteria bacterium]|nr:MAG: hypothetical protein H6767_08200 [Candidatus Peribacteria bacterium]